MVVAGSSMLVRSVAGLTPIATTSGGTEPQRSALAQLQHAEQ